MDAIDGLRLQGVLAAHDPVLTLARHRSLYVRGADTRASQESRAGAEVSFSVLRP